MVLILQYFLMAAVCMICTLTKLVLIPLSMLLLNLSFTHYTCENS